MWALSGAREHHFRDLWRISMEYDEDARADSEFEGEIRVASRIIDYLSSGLYESPASCLKELINNAYDADADEVSLYVKPDADRIIIEDNGCGISRAEFETHFSRISESHKRDAGETTSSGRKKVGKIGIGFIAANELCDVMEIFSTKEGSRELLHVKINFAEMRNPPEVRRRDEGDYAKADYDGDVSFEESPESHFTYVLLKDVRGAAKSILAGKKDESESEGNGVSFFGLNEDSICENLKKTSIRTWHDLAPYTRAMLEIGLNIPVKYYDDWIPKGLEKSIRDMVEDVSSLGFTVYYDGTELRKPIVFNPNGKSFVERFEYDGENVSARGYFYVQHGSIKPIELQGLLVRIRNAAVGDYDHSFWDFSQSEYSLIQRWVSCEIFADDRLEDAMNIDRRTLRITHPAYVELKSQIHNKLRSVLGRARKEIYQSGSQERRQEKAREEVTKIKDTLKEKKKISMSPGSVKRIVDQWPTVEQGGVKSEKAILKKYSVSEFYGVVLDVATEVLSDKDREAFLMELTRRLQKGK